MLPSETKGFLPLDEKLEFNGERLARVRHELSKLAKGSARNKSFKIPIW